MDRRVEDLMARLGIGDETATAADARALMETALDLGASDDEVMRAARHYALGPLTIDLALRPPGEPRSLDAFVADSGLDPAFVQRAWLAFGLPADGDVTADIAAAIGTLAWLAETLGEDAVLGVARVIGTSGAQLAAAIATASRVGLEMPQLDRGASYSDVMVEMARHSRELLPRLWDAVGAVFRRHVVLVSYQAWAPDEARTAITVTTTVGFVDLAGSTDVLRTLTVSELAAAVNHFEQLVGDIVTRAGGRVVKMIGDEAMFVVEDPVAACRLAGDLVAASAQPVRVGLARGDVIAFHGDFYGPTVNLAARLVAEAEPATILADEALAAAVAGAVGFAPVDVGPLRGFPDVRTACQVVDVS